MSIRTMTIHERTMQWYIERMKVDDHFSFVGYSDAEWFCMFGLREGERTGFGQTISKEHGERLRDVMIRRQGDPKFLFAIPKILWTLPVFDRDMIGKYLKHHHLKIEGYERDMVLDDLAAAGGLYPFIEQLRKMSVTMIGNDLLMHPHVYRAVRWKRFIPITSPDHHMLQVGEKTGIEETVEQVLRDPIPGVYCVSAGVSAAVIIDKLYDRIPNSWFLDCGSIWDAFAGIGGQRQWRADLYQKPEELERWKVKNWTGK